jgi:enoyl-CoA hydratase/carnithine racemase
MRKLLRASETSSLVEQFDAERRSLIGLAAAEDAHEGIAAFAQKRPPVSTP